jgi:hypothetical protein
MEKNVVLHFSDKAICKAAYTQLKNCGVKIKDCSLYQTGFISRNKSTIAKYALAGAAAGAVLNFAGISPASFAVTAMFAALIAGAAAAVYYYISDSRASSGLQFILPGADIFSITCIEDTDSSKQTIREISSALSAISA